MAGTGAGLTPRQFDEALRHLGCQVIRRNGGHTIWKAPSGEMVVGPTSGRQGHVPILCVKNAARALGMTLRELVP